MSSRRLLLLAVGLLVGLAGCKDTPTSILLTVEQGAGLPAPDELRLSVFVATGVAVQDRRLPESGPPQLPDEVVLFPRESEGEVDILVRALAEATTVGEGAITVELRPGEQVRATVTVTPGALPDRDGDGVPDVIDSCPDLPNPDQGPCGGADAGDGGTDGTTDGGPDAGPDLTPDTLDCDEDNDNHLALVCGGLDCDDTDPDVYPGADEGPPKDPTCQDNKDNDCDGATDTADTGCKSCTADSECDDDNICTQDRCTGNHCSNDATNEGQSCDDGNACTTGESCAAGLCAGGQPVSCPPPASPCVQASCDPQQGCVTSNKPDNTSCDDGQYCTVSESCSAGVCQGDPRDCSSGVPDCQQGSCNETQDACVYSPVGDGSTCDDNDPCTQGESCQNGSCAAPALLKEIVDALNVGWRSDRSLAIDGQGALHTAYRDHAAGRLKYASNATGAWKLEVVDQSNPDTGAWPALAIGANGTVRIAYTDFTNGNTRLAGRPAGATAWLTMTVDGGAGHNAIAVDASGAVHIAYQKGSALYYATGTPPQLTTTLVDEVTVNNDNVGYHSSLALDSAGKVHIAHGRGSTTMVGGLPWDQIKQLRYSTNAGGSWSTSTPAAGSGLGDHGGFPSIAVGAGGNLYVTHTDSTQFTATSGTLYLTTRKGGTWATASVGNGSFSSLLLDSNENTHVAYRDPTTATLMHAAPGSSGGWAKTAIDSLGANTAGWASIAQQTSGTIHVTYEVGTSSLKHAAFSACP